MPQLPIHRLQFAATANDSDNMFWSEPFANVENAHCSLTCTFENNVVEVWLTAFARLTNLTFEAVLPVVPAHDDRLLLNGYQSWTHTFEALPTDKYPRPRDLALPIAKPYGDNGFYPYKSNAANLHSYNYTYIRDKQGKLLFFYSLDETQAYTIFEFPFQQNVVLRKDLKGMVVESGEEVCLLRLLVAIGNEDDIQTALQHHKPANKIPPPVVGFTSWYHYYTRVTQQDIVNNLNAFVDNKLPTAIIQIDDGWQTAVGDWFSINKTFPLGMQALANLIKAKGHTPGIWLAPFVCDSRSDIWKNHPNWILKNEKGEPVKAGFNPGWGGWLSPWFYSLDFYNPDVQQYLYKVFQTMVQDWGYALLKIDFLYAVALHPPAGKTRGRVMFEAMQFIRKAAGDALLLGCGMPLGSGAGLVDYCRTGCDVGPTPEDNIMNLLKVPERISNTNALHDTICRRHLNGIAFAADPDVFYLRNEKQNLSPDMKYTMLLMNLISGELIFTSDNITNYDTLAMQLFKSIFPHRQRKIVAVNFENGVYVILLEIGTNTYTVYVNTTAQHKQVSLVPGSFFLSAESPLQTKESYRFMKGGSLTGLRPWQSLCMLNVPTATGSLIGGTDHIFPGSSIESLEYKDNTLTLQRSAQAQNAGTLWILAQHAGQVLHYKGAPVTALPIDKNIAAWQLLLQ